MTFAFLDGLLSQHIVEALRILAWCRSSALQLLDSQVVVEVL